MEEAGKEKLVDLIKKECRAFAVMIVASMKERLSADWNYIQTLELIDPLGPSLELRATDDVWEALRDLCDRRNLDYDDVKEQILQIQAEAEDLDRGSRELIKHDLRSYLQDRHAGFVRAQKPSPTKDYDAFCLVVFTPT